MMGKSKITDVKYNHGEKLGFGVAAMSCLLKNMSVDLTDGSAKCCLFMMMGTLGTRVPNFYLNLGRKQVFLILIFRVVI